MTNHNQLSLLEHGPSESELVGPIFKTAEETEDEIRTRRDERYKEIISSVNSIHARIKPLKRDQGKSVRSKILDIDNAISEKDRIIRKLLKKIDKLEKGILL